MRTQVKYIYKTQSRYTFVINIPDIKWQYKTNQLDQLASNFSSLLLCFEVKQDIQQTNTVDCDVCIEEVGAI